MPRALKLLSVVKDQAYGHGALGVAKIALKSGASYLGVSTLDEALELREGGISAPILLFGERPERELDCCVGFDLTCCISDFKTAQTFSRFALSTGRRVRTHVEVDTGLSRYGVKWTEAVEMILAIGQLEGIELEGVMSHFAMSDELDKTFALEQIRQFKEVQEGLAKESVSVKYFHMCNTGGYLDLPQAHFDMVRIGILPLGVYPSRVCRRIAGLKPIMTVKSWVAVIRKLKAGDRVGYGMRYRAPSERVAAVLPLGYGDGYPRLCNQGEVLIHGKPAPIIGGVSMDAMMVDITDIPETRQWDEVVIMGSQGSKRIGVHDLAGWKGSVSYDILSGWNLRLQRVYI